jgi:hypothetical protein
MIVMDMFADTNIQIYALHVVRSGGAYPSSSGDDGGGRSGEETSGGAALEPVDAATVGPAGAAVETADAATVEPARAAVMTTVADGAVRRTAVETTRAAVEPVLQHWGRHGDRVQMATATRAGGGY